MFGVMNDVIQTANRILTTETAQDRNRRIQRDRWTTQSEQRDAFERNLSHCRGYW